MIVENQDSPSFKEIFLEKRKMTVTDRVINISPSRIQKAHTIATDRTTSTIRDQRSLQ